MKTEIMSSFAHIILMYLLLNAKLHMLQFGMLT